MSRRKSLVLLTGGRFSFRSRRRVPNNQSFKAYRVSRYLVNYGRKLLTVLSSSVKIKKTYFLVSFYYYYLEIFDILRGEKDSFARKEPAFRLNEKIDYAIGVNYTNQNT